MARNSATRSRATIIKLPDQTPGLLFSGSGQLPFRVEQVWNSPTAPAVNMVVELETDAMGVPVGIWALDTQSTREKISQIGGSVAQRQDKQAAGVGTQHFRLWARAIGNAALEAAVLLWLGWLTLPVIRLDVDFFAKSNTFWELTGI